jgi:ketosteroid isomerase-like protein
MTTPGEAAMASVVAERVRLLEAFARAWDEGDVDALMDLMGDDCTFSSSTGPGPGAVFSGRQDVRRGFEFFLSPGTSRGPKSEVTGTLVNGDFAVVRWQVPTADGSGDAEVRACDIFEFAGDRIRSKDTYRKIAAELFPG